MYSNIDVVVSKPVTGRASIYVQLNYKKVNCLRFLYRKEVCQHSHSSDPVPDHTICTIHCNILL